MTTPHEGIAPFDAVLDRYFKERLTALLSDPATVEAAFQSAMQKLGKPDDEFNQWHMEEGGIRAVLYDALQAIKEMV